MVISHTSNRGYGGALRSGFAAAQKDWVFYTDGDSQYNPLEVIALANGLTEGVDAVNGDKSTRSDPLIRILVGRAYHYLLKLLFRFRLRDVDCDFRLIPRRILDEIHLTRDSGAICLEMVRKVEDAGYVFAEVPVSHYPRKYGVSQFFMPRRIYDTLLQIAGLYRALMRKK